MHTEIKLWLKKKTKTKKQTNSNAIKMASVHAKNPVNKTLTTSFFFFFNFLVIAIKNKYIDKLLETCRIKT